MSEKLKSLGYTEVHLETATSLGISLELLELASGGSYPAGGLVLDQAATLLEAKPTLVDNISFRKSVEDQIVAFSEAEEADLAETRELTVGECRERFLEEVGVIARESTRYGRGPQESVNQALFSTLVLIDGHRGLPAFRLVPAPHSSDKEFHRDIGENWWPESDPIPGDIATECLHDLVHSYLPDSREDVLSELWKTVDNFPTLLETFDDDPV